MSRYEGIETYRALEEAFHKLGLHRPMRLDRYESGTDLCYDVTGVAVKKTGRVRLRVERFVGGGFAGQVYRVKVLENEGEEGPLQGLHRDRPYAMKILIPPSGSSRLFRNALYWAGFQGPFQLQVNPHAARAGALWQTFIRRGAGKRFGDEGAVSEILGTFVDTRLGSCGELSEWIDGRTWRLEVDDRLDLLKRWQKGKARHNGHLGSPEYRAKHTFMHDFVRLLHEMGAHEFARQYEWSTWKSQPNTLKRHSADRDPAEGLVAVDFRAGLVLLPFLPMSPGDVRLIWEGIKRGSLVQFDRGNLDRLEAYVNARSGLFADLRPRMEELRTSEAIYRDSLPDIAHHHLRLLYSKTLWSRITASAVRGWRTRDWIDPAHEERLSRNRVLTLLFCLLTLIPLIGRPLLKRWGHPAWRRHYGALFSSPGYLKRALQGKCVERLIGWHRAGRMDAGRALQAAGRIGPCLLHLPFSLLPAGIHRFLTDGTYARERLDNLLLRPVRLYFNAELREQWLRDMVEEGGRKSLLSEEDAGVILSQIKEPYIQKYLKSLAVHLCTLPVTQVVSLIVAVTYVLLHPEMPRAQAYGIGLGIIALFQVVPISPGSLTRGLYVLYLVIRERNFKDYNIALFLGFFKYVGYLAFPLQMAYRYPALARFMAGHWATEAVHVVPVFGESGALLEHKIFCLFYNWPLTVGRRVRQRCARRAESPARSWHVPLCALAGAGVFIAADALGLYKAGRMPALGEIWWLVLGVPLLCGAAVTLGAGGTPLGRRIVAGTLCGVLCGILCGVSPFMPMGGDTLTLGDVLSRGLWRVFLFAILTTLGAILTEIFHPEPEA